MFSSLPQNSILIAPQHLHPFIRKQMLQDKKGVLGLSIYSLSTFLSIHITDKLPSKECLYFQYRQQLAPLASTIQIYQQTYMSYPFLQQCSSFLEDMKRYHISPEQLPTQNEAQKELQQIMATLYPLPNPIDHIQKACIKLSQMKLHHVYLYPAFFSYEEYTIIQQLQKAGATLLKEEQPQIETSFFHSINMRQEVESLAQYILHHQLQADEITIRVCDSFYKPLIQQVFERYQLPFTILKQTSPSIFIKRFIKLLSYYIKPCKKNLQACIDAQIWHFPHLYDYCTYTHIFNKHIHDSFHHIDSLPSHESELIHSYELEKLQDLQQHAQEVKDLLLPIIVKLENTQSYEELFVYLYEIVASSFSSSLPASAQTLQQILQDTLSYIHTTEDLHFLIDLLENVQEQEQPTTYQGILISDLQASLLPTTYHFILGATQNAFPAFQTKQGIFDETYRKQLSYPTMKERYDHHLTQINQLYYRCNHLIVSYPIGNYEGKGQEASLEIENFLQKKAVPYPLLSNDQTVPLSYTISQETAHQLFLKDHTLKGSISAFERYIQCPFSYFLRYGLQIKNPTSYAFDEAKIGILSHFLLETLTTRYGKAYTQATKEEILAILSPELSYMKELYPHHEAIIHTIKQRLIQSIQYNLEMLKELEEHSHLTPTYMEYAFLHDLFLEDVHIQLKGFIDRIDASREFLCILDYKSSNKELTEKDVWKALQLQLVTYAFIAQKDLQKPVLGAYYVSLKNNNLTCPAGKITRRSIAYVPLQKQDYEENLRKQNRLKGWTMHEDIAAMDDNGGHIVGVSMKKDGSIKTAKIRDLDTLEQNFHQMYKIIAHRILQGKIDCKPYKDACLFCHYKEICRYNGPFDEKQPLIDIKEEKGEN
ncbi:MAG: PD-(D/E)XK nuclease family protein [Erysipelotrichaceae bacterium]|nr:PD-(D/E)XK nuclease family protein [Erysipelotrichaceae bacterium]